MANKYIAFDIETAKEFPGGGAEWRLHRPLGITCIASQSTEDDEPRVWLSRSEDGTPAAKMSQADVAEFVHYLSDAVTNGFTPLSWNGLSFDFDVLAEESSLAEECKTLARGHVDMMFHVVCEKGFPVALNNAAAGLGLQGKLAGVEGVEAPALWAGGQFDKVMEYVAQDVRTTLEVAIESESRTAFAWKTQKGKISTMSLKKGWLSVDEASSLPLPDTSWMSDPLSRDDFMSWLGETR